MCGHAPARVLANVRAHCERLRSMHLLWSGGAKCEVKMQSAFDWIPIASPPQTRCTGTPTTYGRTAARCALQQRTQCIGQWRSLAQTNCKAVRLKVRAQLHLKVVVAVASAIAMQPQFECRRTSTQACYFLRIRNHCRFGRARGDCSLLSARPLAK